MSLLGTVTGTGGATGTRFPSLPMPVRKPPASRGKRRPVLRLLPATRRTGAAHYACWRFALQFSRFARHLDARKRRRAPPGTPFPPAGPGARSRGSLLLRRDHHDHLPAFQARPGLDNDVVAQVGLDPGGHLPAQPLVAHLAATDADVDFGFVAALQEAADRPQLSLVVGLVSHRPERQFLVLVLLLLLLGLGGPLLLFEAELAVVHDLADRRIGV